MARFFPLYSILSRIPGTGPFKREVLKAAEKDFVRKEDVKYLDLFPTNIRRHIAARVEKSIKSDVIRIASKSRMVDKIIFPMIIVVLFLSLFPNFIFIDIQKSGLAIEIICSTFLSFVLYSAVIVYMYITEGGSSEGDFNAYYTLFFDILFILIIIPFLYTDFFNDAVSRIIVSSFCSAITCNTLFLVLVILSSSLMDMPNGRNDTEEALVANYYQLLTSLKIKTTSSDLSINRRYYLTKMSFISSLYSHSAFSVLQGEDKETVAWHKRLCAERSNAVRIKKRLFINPQSKTLEEVQGWVESQFVAVALAHWDEVERVSVSNADNRSITAKIIDWIRALLIALVPAVVLWTLHFYFPKINIPDAYNLGAAAWALFIVVLRIDPQISEKIAAFKQTFDNLQTLKSKD